MDHIFFQNKIFKHAHSHHLLSQMYKHIDHIFSKENTVDNQRKAFSKLRDKTAVAKLFNEIGPRFIERPGGYLRVIKRGYRPGDKSPIAQIEFLQEEAEVSDLETTQESTS